MRELRDIKTNYLMQYHALYLEMMKSQKLGSYKQKYEDIISNISKVDQTIEHVRRYYELVNQDMQETHETLMNQYNHLLAQMKSNAGDTKSKSKVTSTLATHNKATDIAVQLKKLREDSMPIDYFLEQLPSFDAKKTTVKPPEIAKPQVEQKVTEPKTKVKKISQTQIQVIKHNVKKLIAEKFPFQNKEQCLSRKKPYFMSTKDIIDRIESTPEIKSVMPPKYKTLSKEKLCDHLFF
jgi:hypothetical protein